MILRRGAVIVLSLGLGAAAPIFTPGVAMGDGGTAKESLVRHAPSARDDAPSRDSLPETDKNDCDGASQVRLKVLVTDDGRLEATGIVWSDDTDVWDWKFKHNDDLSAAGDVRAKNADKSFKIVRTMYNFTGPDTVFFRADNTATGETCKATVNY